MTRTFVIFLLGMGVCAAQPPTIRLGAKLVVEDPQEPAAPVMAAPAVVEEHPSTVCVTEATVGGVVISQEPVVEVAPEPPGEPVLVVPTLRVDSPFVPQPPSFPTGVPSAPVLSDDNIRVLPAEPVAPVDSGARYYSDAEAGALVEVASTSPKADVVVGRLW